MGMFQFHIRTKADWPKPRYAKKSSRIRLVFLGAVALALVFVAVLLRTCFSTQDARFSKQIGAAYSTDETQNAVKNAPPKNTGIEKFTTKQLGNADTRRGSLILVNRAHGYVFSDTDADELVRLLDFSNKDYFVSDWSIRMEKEAAQALETGIASVAKDGGGKLLLADRAYRSKADQETAYNQYYEIASGEERSISEKEVMQVCAPTASDYLTGLSVHLSLYAGGEANESERYDTICKDLNAAGFVLRYPKEKETTTLVRSNAGQFRYVGKVHAAIMTAHGWCLEEYIEQLQKLEAEQKALIETVDDQKVCVYRLAVAKSGKTDISVPDGTAYSLSGDNCGGVIITVIL